MRFRVEPLIPALNHATIPGLPLVEAFGPFRALLTALPYEDSERIQKKLVELLLNETVENLGIVGDVVYVKPGFARNYLLPLQIAEVPTPEKVEALKELKPLPRRSSKPSARSASTPSATSRASRSS